MTRTTALTRVLDAVRRRRRRNPGDRGAMALLVAVLLAGGILIGVGGVAVDVGRLYLERGELQNGADAAALAAARQCATDPTLCRVSDLGTVIGQQAKSNASDGKAAAKVTCGRKTLPSPGALGPCGPGATNRTKCVGDRPASGNYVEVRTSTVYQDGRTVIPPTITQLIPGAPKKGTTVGACARAIWGSPQKIPKAFPVMISKCLWNWATSNGTVYADPAARSLLSLDWSLQRTLTNDNTACPSGVAGDMGQYGHLAQIRWANAACQASVDLDSVVEAAEGTSLLAGVWKWIGGCNVDTWLTWLLSALTLSLPPVVYLPVFDSVTKSGLVYRYHVVGFAPIRLTSLALGLSGVRVPPVPNCGGLNPFAVCLQGFFTRSLAPGPTRGGQDFGTAAISLAG
ncbi:hypothetical protein GQ466_11055 [Actinomadura rayongensis]|uniref:Putative Flp pilus-assembly TadG-like N-terminal domain-containing protein n=2 Tax=Actinomadura rayongensis TaxID=1429076 RepID=A0A6I4W8J8_9ACTN|nr:hypothetical protein [Actinomadura rayongensis]